MKYMAKTLIDSMKNWTPEELVFNAITWNEGYRFFGCSRDLSIIKKWVRKENIGYAWLCTSLLPDNQEDKEDKIIRKNQIWNQLN